MTTVSEGNPRLVYLSEDSVNGVEGLCKVIRNSWWIVHPELGLVFFQTAPNRVGQLKGASPQCHKDRAVTAQLKKELYPWAKIKKIPLVIVPINPKDY